MVKMRSDAPMREADARKAASIMRANSLSLAKAIQAAESRSDGMAVSATCYPSENQPVAKVCCVDNQDRVKLVLVDLNTGKVTAVRDGEAAFSSMAAPQIAKASDVIGETVQNTAGESLGKINDLIIDRPQGRVAYAVVSYGGVLGINAKLLAVPWRSLDASGAEGFVLDIDKARFDRAPSFDSTHWPDMTDPEWVRSIHGYYDRPSNRDMRKDIDHKTSAAGMSPLTKASDLMGTKVTNASDEDLGKIEDLAVDRQDGKVRYAVLSYGGFLGFNDKLFAVPWDALTHSHDGKCILNVRKDQLKNAPGFDKARWPDLADPEFDRTVRGYYEPATNR